MKYLIYIVLIVSCVGAYETHAQALQNELNLSAKWVEGRPQELYLKVDILDVRYRLYNYQFNFFTQQSETAEIKRLVYVDSVYLGSEKSTHYIKFVFTKISKNIQVQLFNRSNGRESKLNVNQKVPFVLLKNDSLPIVNSWVSRQGITVPKRSFVYYYRYPFSLAQPPMVTKREASRALTIDSTFTVAGNLKANEEGFYIFQTDTTSNEAVQLKICDQYYPKLATIELLTEPLIYITDREEQLRLQEVGNDKVKFDRFWLELTDSPERARDIIKRYYNRVEEANTRFTTFKEGWKTDKGMIYLVMGEPDIVEKSDSKEQWIYRETRHLPKRTYQFIKASTIFSPDHYVLIREKKHADSWFLAVDLLRKGIFK